MRNARTLFERISSIRAEDVAHILQQVSEEGRVKLEFAEGDTELEGKFTHLSIAILADNEALATFLLAQGAPPDECPELRFPPWDVTPLMLAAELCRCWAVRLLIDNGASVMAIDRHAPGETGKCTALHYAAGSGCTCAIELLVGAGGKVDALDSAKHSPLDYACMRSHSDAVRVLLGYGAKPLLRKYQTFGPLAAAVDQGDTEVVLMLLDHGAEVNEFASSTPLLSAVDSGRSKLVDLLLERGANPNLWPRHRISPLMSAVIRGDAEVAKKLIVAGADVNAKDRDGRTALFFAKRDRRRAMVRLLQQNGAIESPPASPHLSNEN